MILVDTTIVSVANPAIKAALDPDTNNLDNVVWVTSAYLLAYAVPLLITGRLGDRFGPKNIYLIGLSVFTLASLWCGLSGTLEMLIVARAVQGLGAALMTPQTMAVITRTFPPNRRGAAMGLWGATAGVATLVGPLAGGLLVDGLGWEWIFFINIPVGIIAFVLAWILVPRLETHPHRFDIVGVVLSAVGLFLIVFGLQEGEKYDWGAIWADTWAMITAVCVVMAIFVWTQARTKSEPLVPLPLFRERNFSVSNLAISMVGFTVTSMSLPLMFFIQLVARSHADGVRAAAHPDGGAVGRARAVRRTPARPHRPAVPAGPGPAPRRGIALLVLVAHEHRHAHLDVPAPVGPHGHRQRRACGVRSRRPPPATCPRRQAGAGAGIYNTTRTIGSVIGSASIAAFMQARLEANLPGAADAAGGFGEGTLPPFVVDGFSQAMAQAILLPAVVMLAGVVVVLFLRRPKATSTEDWQAANAAVAAE